MNNQASMNGKSHNSPEVMRLLKASQTHKKLDLMTILGISGSILIISAVMVLGGSPKIFLSLSSFLVVVGGTVFISMISASAKELKSIPRIIKWSIFERKNNPQQVAKKMIFLSVIARQKGLLVLEKYIEEFKNEPFMQKCLTTLSDGTPAKDIEEVLKSDLASMAHRHLQGVTIIRQAADVAPAMGLIGTLIGLVQMLGQLEDPSTIGPAMAIALLTTFYGAILGSMFLTPLANKLERNSDDETLIMRIRTMGAISIAKQENPRRLEMLLNTILPGIHKVKYFE